MRRQMSRFPGSIALAVIALLPVVPAAANAAEPPAAASGTAPSPAKPMSVPEDGSGSQDFPASSRLVRDIIASRPQEDMIICIAGCRPGADRVVYAQPADPTAAKKPEVAQGESALPPTAAAATEPPVAPIIANPVSGNTDNFSQAPKAAEEPKETPAAQSASDRSPEAEHGGRMEPTAAKPEADDASPTPSEETTSAPEAREPAERPSEGADEPAPASDLR